MNSKKLEIIVAEKAGFCMGVRRALNLTLNAANAPGAPQPIATIGPLIHNHQVLQVLKQKGIRILGEDGRDSCGTAVIRAHGVSPETRQRIEEHAKNIVDATCPHVRNVQKIAKEYTGKGYHCIVVGDPGHAEVEGVLSYAGKRGTVIRGPEDMDNLPAEAEKVVVVAQTTQNEKLYEEVAEKIRQRYPECEVFDTICRATHQRQREAVEIAQGADAMIVVGGHHSANTCRLARICGETGTPTYHVETEAELPIRDLLQCGRIGITAGASTPHWMIRRVVGRIRAEHRRNVTPWLYRLQNALRLPVRLNLVLAGAAAALTYTCIHLMGLPGSLAHLSLPIAFAFILSQHTMNQHAKRQAMCLNEPERGEFFCTYSHLLKLLAIGSGATALALSLALGLAPFLLLLLGTLGGLIYCLPSSASASWNLPGVHRLAGSKEFLVATAWSATAVWVPALAAGIGSIRWQTLLAATLFSFLLAFYRTLLVDLEDIEGDQLVGRETLGAVMGHRMCYRLMDTILVAAIMVVLAATLLAWTSTLGYIILAVSPYTLIVHRAFKRRRLPHGEITEAIVDITCYGCALLTVLYITF
jgi:4-hydroxy-3-methylbut-2-enyl diphosphate reductase